MCFRRHLYAWLLTSLHFTLHTVRYDDRMASVKEKKPYAKHGIASKFRGLVMKMQTNMCSIFCLFIISKRQSSVTKKQDKENILPLKVWQPRSPVRNTLSSSLKSHDWHGCRSVKQKLFIIFIYNFFFSQLLMGLSHSAITDHSCFDLYQLQVVKIYFWNKAVYFKRKKNDKVVCKQITV